MRIFARKRSKSAIPDHFTQTSAYDYLSSGPAPEIGTLPYRPSSEISTSRENTKRKGLPSGPNNTRENRNVEPRAFTISHSHEDDRPQSRGRDERPKPVNGAHRSGTPRKKYVYPRDSLPSISPVGSEKYFDMLRSAIGPTATNDRPYTKFDEEVVNRNLTYPHNAQDRPYSHNVVDLLQVESGATEKPYRAANKISGELSRPKTIHSFAQVHGRDQSPSRERKDLFQPRPAGPRTHQSRRATSASRQSSRQCAQEELVRQETLETRRDSIAKSNGEEGSQTPSQKDPEIRRKLSKERKASKEWKAPRDQRRQSQGEKFYSLTPQINSQPGRERVLRLAAISTDNLPLANVYEERPHRPEERPVSSMSGRSFSKRKSLVSLQNSGKNKSQQSLVDTQAGETRSRSNSVRDLPQQSGYNGPDMDVPPGFAESRKRRSKTSLRPGRVQHSVSVSLHRGMSSSSSLPPGTFRERPNQKLRPTSSPIKKSTLPLRSAPLSPAIGSIDESSDGPQADVGDDPSTGELAAARIPQSLESLQRSDNFSVSGRCHGLEQGLERGIFSQHQLERSEKRHQKRVAEMAAQFTAHTAQNSYSSSAASPTKANDDLYDVRSFEESEPLPTSRRIIGSYLSRDEENSNRATLALIPNPLSIPKRKVSLEENRGKLSRSSTTAQSIRKRRSRRMVEPYSPVKPQPLSMRDFATDPPTVPKITKNDRIRPIDSLGSSTENKKHRPKQDLKLSTATLAKSPKTRSKPNRSHSATDLRVRSLYSPLQDLYGNAERKVPTHPPDVASYRHEPTIHSVDPDHPPARMGWAAIAGGDSIHVAPAPSVARRSRSRTTSISSTISASSKKRSARAGAHERSDGAANVRRHTLSNASSILNNDTVEYRRLEALKAELNISNFPRRTYIDVDELIPPVPIIPDAICRHSTNVTPVTSRPSTPTSTATTSKRKSMSASSAAASSPRQKGILKTKSTHTYIRNRSASTTTDTPSSRDTTVSTTASSLFSAAPTEHRHKGSASSTRSKTNGSTETDENETQNERRTMESEGKTDTKDNALKKKRNIGTINERTVHVAFQTHDLGWE
ncbi:MAG: hypothetical protein Q9227_007705 [Pyrenula ochraceoflavens]